MGLFNDIFLSKDEKTVIDIVREVDNYWRNTNDFLVAHQRYIQDLEFKFRLNLSEDLLIMIPGMITAIGFSKQLSQKNTIYIFSQFICYFMFGWQKPNRIRHTNEYILSSLERISEYIVRNSSKIDVDLPYILNKNNAKKLV